MKFGLLLLLCLSFSYQAQAKTLADFFGGIFGGKREQPATNDGEVTNANEDVPVSSDVRIVIDRNPKVQQMKIYLEGQELPWKTVNVSTGRETFDIPTNFKRNPECSTTPTNDPSKPFRIQRMYELYRSNTWLYKDETTGKMVGSDMPNSIFFNGGIAIHAATGDGIASLGPKETSQARGGSGGCVRTDPQEVKAIFDLFAKKDSKGNYVRENMTLHSDCRTSTAPRCTDPAQFPVLSNGRKADISVIDTRSPEEQRAVAEACTRDQGRFNTRKSSCLLGKVVANAKSTGGTVDEAKISSDATFRGQYLSDGLKGLTDSMRASFNEECNREVYFEKVTTKCHLREIERLPGHKRTIDPNQGMYDMTAVRALVAKQNKNDMAKIEQLCAQEVNSMMYVSPSDPAPRPTGIPVPKAAPPRDANGKIITQ